MFSGLQKKFKELPAHKQLLLVSVAVFVVEASLFVWGLLGGPPGIYAILPLLIIWFFILVFSIFFFVGEERKNRSGR